MGAGSSRRSVVGGSSTNTDEDVPADDEQLTLSLQRLVIYARSSDVSLQREVAERLANLAVKREMQERIVACGGLQLLVPLTQSSDVEVQRLAAHALANLSVLAANQVAIAEAAGGLEMLVRLLGSPSSEVQRQAAKSMANIAVAGDNKRLIAARGALTPLVALLSAVALPVRAEAVAAVANLAVDDACEEALVAGGALPLILACLPPRGSPHPGGAPGASAPEEDLLIQAARALRNLSCAPAHAAALEKLGGKAVLEALRTHTAVDRLRVQCDKALENLAKV